MIQNANQIALCFAGFPREEAIERVRRHIDTFWERDMKEQLINYVSRGGEGLHELVLEVVKRMPVNA
jgi:hypothetical protein